MIIVVASLKGGVGKTTLAALLSILKSTPAVDADPSANLTDLLSPRCTPTPDAFMRLEFCDTYAGVPMVPSTPDLYDAEANFDIIEWAEKLRARVHVVVDTAPAWNRYTIAALRAADVVLIPVTDSLLSERGAEALARRAKRVSRGRLVVVPALADKRNEERLVERARRVADAIDAVVSPPVYKASVIKDATGSELRRKLGWNTPYVERLRESVNTLMDFILSLSVG